ncbi:phage holin family protein [Prochlorococcus sp. MIT 1300]|uniref:phage holin family protein n=1 Tax=Prochlorococcus sp. MIT 1300 TaxID=3096218 RepID=UPI002A7618FB|nr:phage holin family protein [Prochlorococcus sp. MIT 1300]
MNEAQRSKGLGAAARVTALAGSVMDLHVRIALQEVDREKRRIISGGIFLAMGGTLMLMALLASEGAFFLWTQDAFDWSPIYSLSIITLTNLFLAGLSLRIGGQLTKGPYLRETMEGLSKTTKAVLGQS